MVNAVLVPGPTVTTPAGAMVPFAPAEAVRVKPAKQAPVPRQKGLEASRPAHCASLTQEEQVCVACEQMGEVPEQSESARQPTQAPVVPSQ